MSRYNVAILGATGAVGQEFLKIIEQRNFPFAKLKLLASERSAGRTIGFMGQEYVVEEARPQSFAGVDLALFAGGAASRQLAPEAVSRGAVVIDNSSAFRMDDDVPLVVPEVNSGDLHRHRGIIANPNCSTIIMVVVLKPLHDQAGLKRVVVSTYQAVSGAGKEAIDELDTQVRTWLAGGEMKADILPVASLPRHYPVAFNLIPQIDVFLDNGFTKEEMKMVRETHKILHDDSIGIVPTTVRVPVYRSHSESLSLEFIHSISPEEARAVLSRAPGVIVEDRPEEQVYPMPLYTSHRDEVFVGRIRADHTVPHGLSLWLVGDQIRKGAALNAIQIAEYMIANRLLGG
ncbi:MAG: aspartate-semialdehyde dehydrogenase [Negativicutes bacterium]|nr:aspartate-semialdehyde dehydrogenase [Negativicutes bacterium]